MTATTTTADHHETSTTPPASSTDPEHVRAWSRELAELARQLGLEDYAEGITADTERRLAHQRVRVVVLGEIKHGKSSIINALVGRPVLPVGVTPTTGAVVAVRSGERDERTLIQPDGNPKPLDEQRFATLAKGEAHEDGRIAVSVADAALPGEIELVDTPGINDIQHFQAAISRGELPQADALMVVLDATQLLNRTELAFVRDALAAVGGLGDSGASLLLVINRIDLIEPSSRDELIEHLDRELRSLLGDDRREDAVRMFRTDAKRALASPDADDPAVADLRRLRQAILEIGGRRDSLLPARARGALGRHAALLAHHAAVQYRALTLDEEALKIEIEQVREALTRQREDMDRLRELLEAGRKRLTEESRQRIDAFQEQLQTSALTHAQYANLRTLSSNFPGSIHDAFVAFAREESDRLRGSLDELTRRVLHTHSEQVQRNLAKAALRLGLRGPTVYVDPPSLALEAGAVAVGVAGTAIMYFGNLVAGMTMTVAGPLATVVIREQSLRRAREQARTTLPSALARGTDALRATIERVINEHVEAVEEHMALADAQLGEQLIAVLNRAHELLSGDPGTLSERRESAKEKLAVSERRLAELREQLTPGGARAEPVIPVGSA